MRSCKLIHRCPELYMGPTLRTGIGLRMESSIFRILIFLLAEITHIKGVHRSAEPVIRKGFYDTVTGTALGAISKRVLEAPIIGIHYFGTTFHTGSKIRKNPRAGIFVRFTAEDFKPGVIFRIYCNPCAIKENKSIVSLTI